MIETNNYEENEKQIETEPNKIEEPMAYTCNICVLAIKKETSLQEHIENHKSNKSDNLAIAGKMDDKDYTEDDLMIA